MESVASPITSAALQPRLRSEWQRAVPGYPRDTAPWLQHERTGNLLRLVTQVKRGAHLRTRLPDGELESQVLRVSPADSAS